VHTAVKWVRVSSTLTGTSNNPIDNAVYDDACVINNTTQQYYLRFGYLLQFLTEKVIPLIKGKDDQPPLFSIDYSTWSNHMYSLPNQISLDPRVCIVKNLEFQKASGTAKAFSPLRKFKEDNNKNAAYPMNVYLNFEFIISSLESNTNERGDVNVYGFISSICTGLNKALGGINNLEPIIDKNENVLRIIEGTPIPGYSALGTNKYELNLFGYQKSGQNNGLNEYTSNFIRKVDLKTAITPEYATMVTVGATANGYVKGTEATAFSRWNKGIIDRFKDELISPNPSTTAKTGGKDEAEYNYVNDFLKYPTSCYGYNGDLFSSSNLGDIDTDIVERNLSIVTEFYKYIIAKAGQKTQQAGTIGFIPFKLGITMDGISGIKIYNKLEVNSRFLPTRYGETLNFIITGVNHRLQDNDWETSLETIVMPKTTAIDKLDIDFTAIVTNSGGGSVSGGGNFGGAGYEPLKKLIFSGESVSYDSMYPGIKYKTKFGVTSMSQTIAKVANTATGAVGRYQFMPRYLLNRARVAGLDPIIALYNEANQEKMGESLIDEKVGPYIKGTVNGNESQLIQYVQALGKAWASLPVIKNEKGVIVGNIKTGAGLYSRNGNTTSGGYYVNSENNYGVIKNKSLIDVVKALMKTRKNLGGSKPDFVPSYVDWNSL
jgi:muramidase (phage lysozyme)